MNNKLLLLASVLSALAMSVAQAQQATDNTNMTASQNSTTATPPPADSNSYGGATNQSAAGSTMKDPNGKQSNCAPASFCDMYKGQ